MKNEITGPLTPIDTRGDKLKEKSIWTMVNGVCVLCTMGGQLVTISLGIWWLHPLKYQSLMTNWLFPPSTTLFCSQNRQSLLMRRLMFTQYWSHFTHRRFASVPQYESQAFGIDTAFIIYGLGLCICCYILRGARVIVKNEKKRPFLAPNQMHQIRQTKLSIVICLVFWGCKNSSICHS